MISRSALNLAGKVALALAVLVGAPLAGMSLTRLRETSPDASEVSKPANAKAPETSSVPNDFVGVLLPPQMANLSPRADGKVLAVRVKIGQEVHPGEVLVQFDARERREDLAMAEAQLRTARAEAGAAGAAANAARMQARMKSKAAVTINGERVALVSAVESKQSQFDAQSAGANAAAAAARIAEQQAKVEQLRVALEETDIRATFNGMVTAINFEPGMTAHPGDIVARVVGGHGLRARIAIPEEAAMLVGKGRARLTLEGKTLFARIDQVAREVEPASRSFFVEGSVELGPNACEGDCAMLAGRAVRATVFDVDVTR
jgi:multidrug efflux pump subunit AcrA (membrane-fusion protein)